MTPLTRLTRAAYGIHFADQIALVSVPLIAALAFDASAQTIGILVACQSLAHLLGSLPFGVMVDRAQLRTLAIAATLISFIGFSGAAASVASGSLFWFALTVTGAGFGVVLFVLTSLSILPKTTAPAGLSRANAQIEIPRALASFAVPLGIGVLISGTTVVWVFPMAALAAITAFGFATGLPTFEKSRLVQANVLQRITDGGRFVLRHNLLLAISLCAVFWNFAFSALLVVMIPLITTVYLADPGTFGINLAAFGLAAVVGSTVARHASGRISPNVILLFGPASSVLAALTLYMIPPGAPVIAIHAAFFLLGFGPAMWLISQNAVRQLVTPGDMLGRVNAVIQTAIYGIRPLGALIAGAVVSTWSPQTGLMLVIAAFGLSFLVAALSGLRSITSYGDLQPRSA